MAIALAPYRLLEAAAWMRDGIALSEIPIKGGWLDLWMKLPGDDNKIELIEAKFTNHIKLIKKNIASTTVCSGRPRLGAAETERWPA